MDGCRARWLVLACFVLAACMLYSCSDDEDGATCPTPKVCTDPTTALLGTWVLFESYTNGVPDQMITGVELDFGTNNKLYARLVGLDTLPWYWMADDDNILIADPEGSVPVTKFEYAFEADTLDMTSVNADDDFYWRLHR